MIFASPSQSTLHLLCTDYTEAADYAAQFLIMCSQQVPCQAPTYLARLQHAFLGVALHQTSCLYHAFRFLYNTLYLFTHQMVTSYSSQICQRHSTNHITQHKLADTGTRHSKDQAGPLAPKHKAGSAKGQSGLEAALQCEEHLADVVAAPPGIGKACRASSPCYLL